MSLDAGYPTQTPGYTTGYTQFQYTLTTDADTYLNTGDGFTIDAVNGLYNAVAPTDWTASIDGSADVTFTYTGAVTGTNQLIDGFDVNTVPGYIYVAGDTFSAWGSSATGVVDNTDSLLAPTNTPEPATAALTSLGLLAAGLASRKFRRPL